MKEIHIAPVQGHTDAAWRHFHHLIYGGDYCYYTPFIRVEHGEIRERDLKDLESELNADIRVIPQVIFRDVEELKILLDTLTARNHKAIDLNMGCPFPLQTSKGRGAATIANIELVKALPALLSQYPDVTFSVKMRLGLADDTEWKECLKILNQIPLRHITIHPRVARDQYKGELRIAQLEDFIKASKAPVIYNGLLNTPDDIASTEAKYATIMGVMPGRGLLGRPSLATEYSTGNEWNHEERIEKMLSFHRKLLAHYQSTLCGEHQILSKIKPFWEYAEDEIGRKAWKAISKASNMAKYNSGVALIKNS